MLRLQVYARFLEYVRGEPGAASRFFEAAVKQDTSESLLALTSAEGTADGIRAATGQIDEKVDGLCVINAQVGCRGHMPVRRLGCVWLAHAATGTVQAYLLLSADSRCQNFM